MKAFLVAVLFVGLASAEFDNINFIQRHKRVSKLDCSWNQNDKAFSM